MTRPAIEVEHLSKKYRVRHPMERTAYRTLREDLAAMAGRLGRRISGRAFHDARDDFWALSDVSFHVPPGEVLGIIGANGAGKSTLLKILGRITRPTQGMLTVRGQVGSLLEVGTGFHPELTGRENIYLSGSILGMPRHDIRAKFDEIVAFAEIERFLDTPVKRYSTGMFVRLGFSVAAHLDPDILLIDEVLAVGDASFQSKCLGKMGSVAHAGRTILFVSHNMTAVQSLCNRVLWIRNGALAADGPPRDVVRDYLLEGAVRQSERTWDDEETAPGNERVRLRRVKVAAAEALASGYITVRTEFQLVVDFWNSAPNARLNLSLVLYNAEGVCVFNTVSQPRACPAGLVRGACRIPGDLLNSGTYRVDVLIVEDASEVLLRVDQAIFFEIHDVAREGAWFGKWVGVTRPRLDWSVEFPKPATGDSHPESSTTE